MDILGWILLAIGGIGIVGNITAGGTAGDPDPRRVYSRFVIWVGLAAIGGVLIWLG